MSVVKRSLALILALIMILMTMGAVTVQTVYAAVTLGNIAIKNVTKTPSKYTDKVTVTFEVEHSNSGIAYDVVKTSSTVTMDTNSDFKENAGTLKVSKILSVSTDSNIVKYQVTATDIAVKSGKTSGTLKLKLNVVEGQTYDSGVMTIDVSGYEDGTGTEDPEKPGTPTEASAKYTVTKVRGTTTKGSGDNTYPAPNDNKVYFEVGDVTSSSDASIRQTYFADITLRVFDEKAPENIAKDNIVGSGVSSMDLGSFYFDSRVSTIEMLDTVEGYYEVKFTGLRYSGNSNKLTFRTRKGSYIGDVTAVVSECISKQDAIKEPSKDDDDDDSKLEVETPYVIVSKYSYGGGNVTAGDTFPLSLTIYNTSETEVVGNMMVTVAVPEGLMLTSSSNTFYVEELDKHASITKSMQVTAKVDAKPQSHTVDVSMKYQYVDDRVNSRRSAETTEKIAIPVVQVDRFQVTAVDIPMESMLGEEISVTVNFVNKGRSEAYNLSAEIDGNIQNPGQNQNLGNLASGATGTADFFIQPSEVGMCTGEIKITYEDTNMEEKSATIRYNTNIKSAEEYMGGGMIVGGGGIGMPGEGEMPIEEKKSSWPLIAGICVVVAIPVIVIIKKKLDAKRKEREDADL